MSLTNIRAIQISKLTTFHLQFKVYTTTYLVDFEFPLIRITLSVFVYTSTQLHVGILREQDTNHFVV